MVNLNWNKKELNVYILLYAAKVDYEITNEETEKIKEKYGEELINKIFAEIKRDSDYQSIEKIKNAMKHLNLSDKEIEESLTYAKDVFKADGKFDAIEKGVFAVLKKVLNLK